MGWQFAHGFLGGKKQAGRNFLATMRSGTHDDHWGSRFNGCPQGQTSERECPNIQPPLGSWPRKMVSGSIGPSSWLDRSHLEHKSRAQHGFTALGFKPQMPLFKEFHHLNWGVNPWLLALQQARSSFQAVPLPSSRASTLISNGL